jgi:hypothetical protein
MERKTAKWTRRRNAAAFKAVALAVVALGDNALAELGQRLRVNRHQIGERKRQPSERIAELSGDAAVADPPVI